MIPLTSSLKTALIVTSFAGLTACGNGQQTTTPQDVETPASSPTTLSLADTIAHPRRADDQVRDKFRNPQETLEFFGITPGKTVAEIWPGWYTDIIAPYLSDNGGQYIAVLNEAGISERLDARIAAYQEKYSDSETYGTISYGTFGKTSPEIAPADSVDIVLTFRNTHSFMRTDLEDRAFAQFFAALKPGGTLGVVQHRLPESAEQNPTGKTGYVQESYIKALAEEAGFEFVESSEINANPQDTANHPYGVWTLPPRSLLPKDDDPLKEEFDADFYKNIGESDRATLKFRKPL